MIPYQVLADKGAIELDFVLCNKEGEFKLEDFEQKIGNSTKLVSIIFASNVSGTIAPIKDIVKIAHEKGALVLVDGAQAVPHLPVDVKKLDIDFLGFSGHKLCGPTGIGCLYGKGDLLEKLSPFIVGGETIVDADLRSHTFESLPHRLEGGIQNYAGAIGLGAAVDYLRNVGMDNIEKYENELAKDLVEGLINVPKLNLIGPTDWKRKNALASFNVKGMGPHDIAMLLDKENICIRSGAHCTYPFHKFIECPKGSARASLNFYNTKEEITIFLEKLNHIVKTLG